MGRWGACERRGQTQPQDFIVNSRNLEGFGTVCNEAGHWCLSKPSIFLFSCSLVIRGDKDEQAVLCSEDKTYDLKVADTSNMLLFIPGCKIPEQLKMEETHCNIIHTEVLSSVSRLR